MAKRRRSASCLGLGCLGTVLLGLILAGLGILATSTGDNLGPADPALGLVQRLALGTYLSVRSPSLDAPAGSPSQSLTLDVKPGMSASEVVAALQAGGLVRDPALLLQYLRYRGLDRGIQAGRYQLRGGQSLRQIAEALQSATAQTTQVTVVEGWRREQIAQVLAASDLRLDPQAFLDASLSPPPGAGLEGLSPGSNLEGYLFPDTYLFEPGTTPEEAVKDMLDDFNQRVTPELRSAFALRGLTLAQAVTLASIIEREAVVPEERPLIASVFFNRLSAGLNLDADPTVQYALGQQPDGSWWKTGLTVDDLELDSPYNTYLYSGLPPGPICNPGLDSLRAVAYPAETNYLYFRAACDGSGKHLFAENYEQHLQNACP
jgi:UPF0755 protein